jgi:hypothetical protein
MRTTSRFSLWMAVLFLAAAVVPLQAQDPGGTAVTRLRAFDEVPAVSSHGNGRFNATISEDGSSVSWQLDYANLRGSVLQAHLHFAQKGVNGGIVVFLCTNLGNGPAGTQACPPPPASISGTFTAINVGSGANAQGIAPGELHELLRAIRAGIVYANVHSDLFPGGEIRGQLTFTPTP